MSQTNIVCVYFLLSDNVIRNKPMIKARHSSLVTA